MHRHFTKEDMQMTKKHMANVILLPLNTYYFTNNKISVHTYLLKCLKLESNDNNSDDNAWKLHHLCLAGRNTKWLHPL